MPIATAGGLYCAHYPNQTLFGTTENVSRENSAPKALGSNGVPGALSGGKSALTAPSSADSVPSLNRSGRHEEEATAVGAGADLPVVCYYGDEGGWGLSGNPAHVKPCSDFDTEGTCPTAEWSEALLQTGTFMCVGRAPPRPPLPRGLNRAKLVAAGVVPGGRTAVVCHMTGPNVVRLPQICPAGVFCPNLFNKTACPAGSFCWPGSTTPAPCAPDILKRARTLLGAPFGLEPADAERRCPLGSERPPTRRAWLLVLLICAVALAAGVRDYDRWREKRALAAEAQLPPVGSDAESGGSWDISPGPDGGNGSGGGGADVPPAMAAALAAAERRRRDPTGAASASGGGGFTRASDRIAFQFRALGMRVRAPPALVERRRAAAGAAAGAAAAVVGNGGGGGLGVLSGEEAEWLSVLHAGSTI
ncbi:hypothetical protein T492DRAFT_1036673 [Pavlovales sp. CCMP2436]|nr:hypothetical protein T492DRAFT_1036673 [Pavlovales sp. CCMP2436]